MSKVDSTYHLVFATKNRRTTIPTELRRDVYKMLYTILKENNCFVFRINGTSNHVHILFNLHPTIALSTIVNRLKTITSHWMSNDDRFLYFKGWCNEYFAETVSRDDVPAKIEYIKNQESHHGLISLEDELTEFYSHHHWIFLPDYFK
ncbi:MAG: IS200/IS605 family transposase [Lachnoclostridium sp.]|nr:IS200/IS605 family transposase [Lachnoclostridium sp.]